MKYKLFGFGVLLTLVASLSGCGDGSSYDYKKLGFRSKGEMEASFSKGYHTKKKLDEMLSPSSLASQDKVADVSVIKEEFQSAPPAVAPITTAPVAPTAPPATAPSAPPSSNQTNMKIKGLVDFYGPSGWAKCAVGQIGIEGLIKRGDAMSEKIKADNRDLGGALVLMNKYMISNGIKETTLQSLAEKAAGTLKTGDQALEIQNQCVAEMNRIIR